MRAVKPISSRSRIVKFDEAPVKPAAPIMTSPDAAPNESGVDGATRQDQRPHMPDIRPCGPGVVRFEIFDLARDDPSHVLSGWCENEVAGGIYSSRDFATLVSDEGNVRRSMTTSLKRRRNEMSILRLMASNEVKSGTASRRTRAEPGRFSLHARQAAGLRSRGCLPRAGYDRAVRRRRLAACATAILRRGAGLRGFPSSLHANPCSRAADWRQHIARPV